MRHASVALVLLLTACSSSSPGTTTLGSPEPVPPTTPSSTPALSSPAAQSGPTPSPTPSPAPRRTASSTPAPRASRTPTPAPSGPKPSPTRSGATYGLDEVTGDMFSPTTLTLRSGDWVLVTDRDPLAPHNFTVSALGVRSGDMGQGDTFRYRFTAVGTFQFVCTYHQAAGMTGTLHVTK